MFKRLIAALCVIALLIPLVAQAQLNQPARTATPIPTEPTQIPTLLPTLTPTLIPTLTSSAAPTKAPPATATLVPTDAPTLAPTLPPPTTAPLEVQPVSAEREIYTVLALGDGIFEPDLWLASGAETGTSTYVSWNAAGLGMVAFADYIHYDNPIDLATWIEWFANIDSWFDTAFASYDSWSLRDTCRSGATTLYILDLTFGGVNYEVRYWVRAATPHRLLTFNIVAPLNSLDLLDDYATRFNSNLSACP